MIGPRGTETAKRIDIYATALFHTMTVDSLSELDLSYTPPLGSSWDAVQMASQYWTREHAAAPVQQAITGSDALREPVARTASLGADTGRR